MTHNSARNATARRVALHKRRRKAGKIVIRPLALDAEVVDFLVRSRLLPPRCNDPTEIAAAVEQHFHLILKEDYAP